MFNRWIVTFLITGILASAGIGLLQHGIYGVTIFVLLPVCLGALAAWSSDARTGPAAAKAGAFAVLVATMALFVMGLEGAICIAMTLPLAVPLGVLGGLLYYSAASARIEKRGTAMLLLLPIASLGWDTHARPPVYEVRSAIEIAASPEEIWPHVTAFSPMSEPPDGILRSGLAYPVSARMEGSGVGARRYCDLSTGPVVETIEIWDEPHVLRFSVSETPAPMQEWSLYGPIQPKHLHGYFVSQEGEFRLTRLGENRTLLEGTSWYRHGLYPAQYWRWWTDAVVRRIHMRVLTHIRSLAEAPPPENRADNGVVKKKLLVHTPPVENWWNLSERVAEVAYTSEDPAHPVEDVLTEGREWRAAAPGEQTIRLTFNEPQKLGRVYLRFVEKDLERTQEFAVRCSNDGGRTFRDVLRQQWNFSPLGSTEEIEDHRTDLVQVSDVELTIRPGTPAAVASVAEFKLA